MYSSFFFLVKKKEKLHDIPVIKNNLSNIYVSEKYFSSLFILLTKPS